MSRTLPKPSVVSRSSARFSEVPVHPRNTSNGRISAAPLSIPRPTQTMPFCTGLDILPETLLIPALVAGPVQCSPLFGREKLVGV